MIKSVSIIKKSVKENFVFDVSQKQKVTLDLDKLDFSNLNSFDIEIVFDQPISQFRNHDYQWVNCDEDRIANEYCPKIIKLQNRQLVQANMSLGIWEINKKNATILLWRFNPEFAASLTNYKGNVNQKKIVKTNKRFSFIENPALLFPTQNAVEFSRSKYPFAAIACFTDHCDFDTLENLEIQRSLFKENGIKVTKGFFLNHFSKRAENASFQNDKEELMKWKDDEHELCYHSLSQSIKSEKESYEDFIQFTPPLEDLKVWIDHGFQPYNFSFLENNIFSESEYGKILGERKINILWNYIDSGTSSDGIINQLNTKQFTLKSFLKGNKSLPFIKKMQLMIKNIIFHYYNDEELILKYKNTAGNFKKAVLQRKINSVFPFLKGFASLGKSIFSVVLFWGKVKNKPYKLAKYAPLLFKHTIGEKEFYVFQTLEMLDFEKSLSANNLKTFISEKGVFIAHTYFSVPMEYHNGKMFSDSKTINPIVSENFKLLGEKIKNQEIWNPTLSQLIDYWSNFEKIVLDIKTDGIIYLKTDTILKMRQLI